MKHSTDHEIAAFALAVHVRNSHDPNRAEDLGDGFPAEDWKERYAGLLRLAKAQDKSADPQWRVHDLQHRVTIR